MCNYNLNIKQLIRIICFVIVPFTGNAQHLDSLSYCSYPNMEVQPPFKMQELLNIFLENHQNKMPDCFDPTGTFYYNITILADGTVALFNLECVSNNQSCIISVDDISKLEKWTSAKQNGNNCNYKMRFKTEIHFE